MRNMMTNPQFVQQVGHTHHSALSCSSRAFNSASDLSALCQLYV
jgi:hypothetical protein